MSCRKENNLNPLSFDIILVAGQSNTHYGTGIDSTFDAADERILQIGRFENDYQMIPAIEPLDHHTKKDSAIGFALTFAKLYKQEYLERGRNILIIPCGYSGSSFQNNHWNLGNPYYLDAVNRTKHVFKHYPKSKLVSILWHQGESDKENANFQAQLDLMIEQMRYDVLDQEVPFILGGMVPYWVNQNDTLIQMQEIIKNTPERLPFCGYANPDLPFVIDKAEDSEDQIHYDAHGQRELGRRYFTAFRSLK